MEGTVRQARLWLAAVLLLAVLAGSSQAAPFVRAIGGIGDDEARAVVPLADGGAIVAGWTEVPGDAFSSAWLLSLDAAGAIRWEHRFGGDVRESFGSAQLLPDGTIVVGGTRRLVAVREDGTIRWQLGGLAVTDLCLLDDGGVGVLAAFATLHRVTADGRVASSGRMIDDPRVALDRVELAADGGFVAVGLLHEGGDFPTSDQLTIRLTPSGALSWSRSLVPSPTLWGAGVRDLLPAPGGGHDVIDRRGHLYGLSDSGLTPWSTYEGGVYLNVASAARSVSGDVLQAGSIGLSADRDLMISKVSARGRPRWTRTYGGPREDAAKAVAEGPDGSIWVVGYTTPHGERGDRDAWVLKLDDRGGAGGDCSRPTDHFRVMIDQPTTTRELPIGPSVPTPSPGLLSDPNAAASSRVREVCYDCVADDYEPDDDCLQARLPLADRTSQSRDFCDDPVDWFTLEATGGVDYQLDATPTGANADPILEIWDPPCQTLLAGGSASSLSWSAPADGTYPVVARQADDSNGVGREYVVRASSNAVGCENWALGYRIPNYRGSAGVMDIAELGDGSLVVVGTRSTNPGPDSLWASRIAPNGTPMWTRSFETDREDRRPTLTAVSGGGVLIRAESHLSGQQRTLVLRLAEDGELLWSRVIENVLRQRISAVAEDPGSGFLLAGDTTEALLVMKLDLDGSLMWERVVRGRTGTLIWGLTRTEDGDFVGITNASNAMHALRFDGDGRFEWAKSYATTERSTVKDVSARPGGGVLVLGYSQVDQYADRHPRLLALDEAGGVDWDHFYDVDGFLEVRAVDSLPDDSALMALWIAEETGPGPSWISITNVLPNGDVRWSRTHGQATARPFVVRSTDEGILVGGTLNLDTGLNEKWAWLLNLDPDSEAGWGCEEAWEPSLTPFAMPVTVEDTAITVGAGTSTIRSDVVVTVIDRDLLVHEPCACTGGLRPPREVSPRGAAIPLLVTEEQQLRWEAAGESGAETFNLYRGSLADLAAGPLSDCLQAGLLDATATDPEPPPPGGGWFYLVTGENDEGEGPMGFSSRWSPRVSAQACP